MKDHFGHEIVEAMKSRYMEADNSDFEVYENWLPKPIDDSDGNDRWERELLP